MKLIVHSHSSVVSQFLKDELEETVIIELSQHPQIGLYLGLETPMSFPGIAGILNKKVSVKKLQIKNDKVAAPIVLASGNSISWNSINEAVGELTENGNKYLLLVNIFDLDNIKPILPRISNIKFYWDIADLPPENLPEFANYLKQEQLINDQIWGGLNLYQTDGRAYSDENKNLLQTTFSQYS